MAIPLPVDSLIDEFAYPGGLTIQRRAAPTTDGKGRLVPGVLSNVLLNPVAIHAASSNDLAQLKEADRVRGVVKVYTRTRLYLSSDGLGSDVVLYNGESWKVVSLENHQAQGNVFMALAQLEDRRK